MLEESNVTEGVPVKFLGVILVSSVVGFSALADQCIYIAPLGTRFGNSANPQKTASDAQNLLNTGRKIVELCEPCGETKPRTLDRGPVTIAEVQEEGKPNYILSMGGREIDLAYIFVDNKNLARSTGCIVYDVSDSL